MTILQYSKSFSALFVLVTLSNFTVLLGQGEYTIQALKGDLLVLDSGGKNDFQLPTLIQTNGRQHKTVFSLQSNQVIHDVNGCSRIIHSTYGKYQGIMLGQPSKQCYDTNFSLSIYEGSELVANLDWEIFISEENPYAYFKPLFINEKEQSIIVFSDSNVLSKYNFKGENLFNYNSTSSCYDLVSYSYLDENFIYLIFSDHIDLIDPSGNLMWTRNGAFVPTVKRTLTARSSYIFDRTSRTGYNIGDNGVTNYSFSFYLTDDMVILPQNFALMGFKLIDFKDNKVVTRLSSLIDKEYREVNTFTASKNGEFFGAFSRRTILNDTVENYMVKIVTRDNEVVAEHIFNFPLPIEFSNFTEFQISNDGNSVFLAHADLSSNIYLITLDLSD